MSGAGSWRFRRDGLKLAKPVSEVKASSDEDADGHIEKIGSLSEFKAIYLSLYSPTESEDNGSNKELKKIRFQERKSGG